MKVCSPWVRTSVRYPSSISILARSATAASVAIKGRYPHAEEVRRARSSSMSVPARAASRASRCGVLRHRIHPDLRALRASMGHRQVQLTEVRHKQRGARSGSRGDGRHRRVMIGILLRHNAERPGTASDVEAPVRRIIEQMVVFPKWRWTAMNVTLGLIFVASLRKEWPMTFIAVRCLHCQSDQIVKRGKTARGTQRYLCQNTL